MRSEAQPIIGCMVGNALDTLFAMAPALALPELSGDELTALEGDIAACRNLLHRRLHDIRAERAHRELDRADAEEREARGL